MIAPTTIPEIAPAYEVFFQNKEKSISGPKVAPNPAQANEVIPKIVLFESQAITIDIMVMTAIAILDAHITCLSVASFLNIP